MNIQIVSKQFIFLKKHFNFWKEKANKPFYKQRKKKGGQAQW
jgi:hypothetical protein